MLHDQRFRYEYIFWFYVILLGLHLGYSWHGSDAFLEKKPERAKKLSRFREKVVKVLPQATKFNLWFLEVVLEN